MVDRIFAYQYDPETRLFYYTVLGANGATGAPYPIAYQYINGMIDIFLNLPTKTKRSIGASLKETTSGGEIIDATYHDTIRDAFGKLVDVSSKRVVWAATEFSGYGFKLIKFSNIARKDVPNKIEATYNVRPSKIPNKLIQIVHGFKDSGHFKMKNGMVYLPTSIGNLIADTIDSEKPNTPTAEEIRLKKDLDAFVQDKTQKTTYKLTLNVSTVKVTKSINGVPSDTLIVGHFEPSKYELDLYPKFESFRHDLYTAVTLANISSGKTRDIDADLGEKLFVALYAPSTEYKPEETPIHDHITAADINKMVENVIDAAGNVSKRLGKPVGDKIVIDLPIEPTIEIEGKLVRAVDEVANLTTEEFVEKCPRKTETTTKPSKPVSDINMKNEKDTNDDLARRLGKFTIKPVPTKTSAISFSNKILLL